MKSQKTIDEILDTQDNEPLKNPYQKGSKPFSKPILSVSKFLDPKLGELRAEEFTVLMDCTGSFKNLRGSGRPLMRHGRKLVRRSFQPGILFQLPDGRVPWFLHNFGLSDAFFGPPGGRRAGITKNEFGESQTPVQYQVSKILDVYIALRLLNGRTHVFQREVEECLNFMHQDQGGTAQAYGPSRMDSYLCIGMWSPDPALSDLVFKPCAFSHQDGISSIFFSKRRKPPTPQPPAEADVVGVSLREDGTFVDQQSGHEMTDEEMRSKLQADGFFQDDPVLVDTQSVFQKRLSASGLGRKKETK
jgi:hypothetical protein